MKVSKYKYLVCILIALLIINIVLIVLVREVKLSEERSSVTTEANEISAQMNELSAVLLKEEIAQEDIEQSRVLILELERKWQHTTLTSEINTKLRTSLDRGWEVLLTIEEGKDNTKARGGYKASVSEFNSEVQKKIDQINKKKLIK